MVYSSTTTVNKIKFHKRNTNDIDIVNISYISVLRVRLYVITVFIISTSNINFFI